MSGKLKYETSNVYQVYLKNLLNRCEQFGVERYGSTMSTAVVECGKRKIIKL